MICAPATVAGQDPSAASLEISLGLGSGRSSGEYRDNATGLVGDVLVGVRVHSVGEGALVSGATYGVHGTGPTTDICIPASDGGCVPGFPEFSVASVLGGWETEDTSFRVLSGPAAVRAYGDWDTIRFAWMGRADAAVPLLWRISATASARGFIVPSYRGDRFQSIGVAAGLRLR